ncbi:MAG TPA: HNH endonuclease [Flavobacteriaceae bacterium]|nr:HNH endonuclease [Flavobacteriaceae bacterium]
MGVSLQTHKILWGKSGNLCSYKPCRNELVIDETESDDDSIIGEVAHIVAKKPDGPRGDSDIPIEERDKFKNLILLCRNHHKMIDDQVDTYTIEVLHQMKEEHLNWVKKNLDIDEEKLKVDLNYAKIIDSIIEKADFENWKAWTSNLVCGGANAIHVEDYENLKTLPEYIISRFWPKVYPKLENSIFNFKNVLNDLLNTFDKYSEKSAGSNMYRSRKLHHIDRYDEELYNELLKKNEFHVYLVQDLTFELTRSANLICEEIRKTINPSFRENEGMLLVETGPDMTFSYRTLKLEYSSEQKKENLPYKGLKKFMQDRDNRDYSHGSGFREDYFIEF